MYLNVITSTTKKVFIYTRQDIKDLPLLEQLVSSCTSCLADNKCIKGLGKETSYGQEPY